MDWGSAVVAGIAALGGGASAIIAWAARADSLAAQDRAERAEASALSAWQRSAVALQEANELRATQYRESVARERRTRRVEVAEHVRRWYAEEAFRRYEDAEPSAERAAERRDLAIRLTASGEPGASALAHEVTEASKAVEVGDLQGAVQAAAEITTLTGKWIRDPDSFFAERANETTVDALMAKMQEAIDFIEKNGPFSAPPDAASEDAEAGDGTTDGTGAESAQQV